MFIFLNKVISLNPEDTNGLKPIFIKNEYTSGVVLALSIPFSAPWSTDTYWVFKRVFSALSSKGDTLLAITTSGNSKNIIKAANKIQRESPKTKIYLQTILPINTQQYQNKLKKDTGNSYYWLESDFEININEQILKTNEFLRNNKIFQVIDLHPLFIDKNSIMNEKYSTDGVHLNELGYQKWIDIINPVLSNIK